MTTEGPNVEASTTPCELALRQAALQRAKSTDDLKREMNGESIGEGGAERHHRAIRSRFRKLVRVALFQSRRGELS